MPQTLVPLAPDLPQPANGAGVPPSSSTGATASEARTTAASTKLQEITNISSALPLPAGPSPVAVRDQASSGEGAGVEAASSVAVSDKKAAAGAADECLGAEAATNPSAGGILAMIRADQALQATGTTTAGVSGAVPGALHGSAPSTRASPSKSGRRSDDVPTRGAAQVHQEVRKRARCRGRK